MTLYIAMALYALTMSISPGPVNAIILSTGVNYGFKNTLPFVTGATTGFIALFMLVNFSVSEINLANNSAFKILGYVGALFLIYIGYKIATSRPEIELTKQNIPTFWQGAVLQWLNPKAWLASLAAISAFGLSGLPLQILAFSAIYYLVCYLSLSLWAIGGQQLSHLLKNPRHLTLFNRMMGGLLIALSLYLMYNLASNN